MFEPTNEEQQFRYYTTILGFVIYTPAFFLYIFWIFRIASNTWNLTRSLRGYERKGEEECNIYKTRVYNYKTAIGRNILMILFGGTEVGYTILIYFYIIVFYLSRLQQNGATSGLTSNCTISTWLVDSYEHPIMLVWYGCVNLGVILCVMSISLTTSYLKSRYLNFPVRKLFAKFAISFSIQAAIILVCSTRYTFILLLIIGPFLILTNIIILCRNSRDFSRFLIFNNRSVFFQHKNTRLYETQGKLHTCYKLTIICVLTSLTFGFLGMLSRNLFYILEILFFGDCLLNTIYGIKLSINISTEWVEHLIFILSLYLYPFFSLLYVSFYSLPLFLISIFSMINKCRLFFRNRNTYIHYNQEIMEAIIRGK